jgi:hypothetical protein
MDLSGVYHELRMDGFSDWVNIKTNSGKKSFQKKQWTSDSTTLHKRTSQIGALRAALSKNTEMAQQLDNCFNDIAESEPKAQETIESTNAFADECYGQLLFRHDLLKPINQIPFFLIVLRFWKIYATPALAISMPLMAIIMPYILIRYVFGLPMPVATYIEIIKKFYAGNGFKGLMPTPELDGQFAAVATGSKQTDSMDFFGKLKFYGQTGWLIFSFAQTMWQPIQTAQHLAALDKTLTEQGAAIRKIYDAASKIRTIYNSLGAKVGRLPFEVAEVAENRMAVASVLDSPDRFKFLLKDIGDWELMYRLAVHPDICLVNWLQRSNPMISLKNTFDIHIGSDRRIAFSVKFEKKKHALLTGPNRGGKSTALRAIGRSIYLAHNYGVAIGTSAVITPLKWMQTCLRLEDIPGSASLFEREVAVASLALSRAASDDHGLLLIDELFHSTNPPDAEIASREFLSQLWSSSTTISVISTHMFQLLDKTPAIQRLCCPATYKEDGTVEYKYGLQPGICNVSSVREILKEQGFYAPKKSG